MNKKIFIDGGYHLGEGLNEFKTILNINQDWVIHAFEPNIHCNTVTTDKNVILHQKAIWVDDCELTFNCENNEISNSPKNNSVSDLDGWGSCLNVIGSSHTFNKQITVNAIDFSEFLKQFKGMDVYCKLDIEGAEFEVLRKLIKNGTISIIKELWVEWHDVDLDNENESTRNILISEISKITKINNWK